MLLNKLKSLFGDDTGEGAQTDEKALELASAALMFEVARADCAVDEAEQQAVRQLLQAEFALSQEEIASVTEEAADSVDAATCLFEFTRAVNELASIDQKRALIGMMWRVAMADKTLSRYEEHLIRKVADLLYVPHADFIQAKQASQ